MPTELRYVGSAEEDGYGYDIRSFGDSGEEMFIEVKTTRGPKSMPFLLTANELECARKLGSAYRIYRVFHFGTRGPAVSCGSAFGGSSAARTQGVCGNRDLICTPKRTAIPLQGPAF